MHSANGRVYLKSSIGPNIIVPQSAIKNATGNSKRYFFVYTTQKIYVTISQKINPVENSMENTGTRSYEYL